MLFGYWLIGVYCSLIDLCCLRCVVVRVVWLVVCRVLFVVYSFMCRCLVSFVVRWLLFLVY